MSCKWFYVNDDNLPFCGIKDSTCEAYDPDEDELLEQEFIDTNIGKPNE